MDPKSQRNFLKSNSLNPKKNHPSKLNPIKLANFLKFLQNIANSTKMESLLYIEKFEQNYNCSFYDFNSIPVEKRRNIFAGIFLLIFYFAFEMLYLPCLGVFARRENRRESCYKLMLFMGLLSLVNIHSSGLIIGIYAARGDVFCSRPLFNYIIGMFAYGFFCSESLMAVILALNRCLEMWDHRIAERLFGQQKTNFWILGAFAYGMFSGFTAIPPTPNGAMLGWFWNPHIPYFVEDPQGAYRGLHFTVHNITIGFGLPLIYAIFYLFMRKKMNLVDGEHQSVEIRKSKKNVFIQVLLIGILHMFVTQLYVYMQYFPVPIWMVMSVSFAWIASQGLIPVIYIVFNKNIRRSIRSHFIGPILSGITSRIVQNQQQPNSHPQMNSVQPMPSIFSILVDKNDAIPKEKNGAAKNANIAISTALI